MTDPNDAREAALDAWWSPDGRVFYHNDARIGFRAGYDAARAESERKVAELQASREIAVDETWEKGTRIEELEAALEKAEARVRELDDDLRVLREEHAELERLHDAATSARDRLDAALATAREQCKVWEDQAVAHARALDTEREQNAALDGRRREGRQLLRRLVKYVREDRAVTPGSTRLERLTEQVDDYLRRTEDPNDILRSALASAPAPDVHIAVSPEAVDECLAANPPPRAECTEEERAVLEVAQARVRELELALKQMTERRDLELKFKDIALAELDGSEKELAQYKDMAKRRGGMLVATHARALEAERQDACTPEERAVLDTIEQQFKRLGDDPPYYQVYAGTSVDIHVAIVINRMLARRAAKKGTET